jgi:hypothetical protein
MLADGDHTGLRFTVARSRSSSAAGLGVVGSPTASRISVAAASTWMRVPAGASRQRAPDHGGRCLHAPAGQPEQREPGLRVLAEPRREREVLLGRVEPAEQPVEVAAHDGGPAGAHWSGPELTAPSSSSASASDR